MKRMGGYWLTMLLMCQPACGSPEEDGQRGYRSKIYGTVEQMPAEVDGVWKVGGRTVIISSSTEIEEEYGRLAPGAYVEMEGRSDGETFWAREVEVKQGADGRRREERADRDPSDDPDEFYGIIRSIPEGGVGVWTIDGREVEVDRHTRIDEEHGRVEVGGWVDVEGIFRDGRLYAREIEVQSR